MAKFLENDVGGIAFDSGRGMVELSRRSASCGFEQIRNCRSVLALAAPLGGPFHIVQCFWFIVGDAWRRGLFIPSHRSLLWFYRRWVS